MKIEKYSLIVQCSSTFVQRCTSVISFTRSQLIYFYKTNISLPSSQ